MDKDVRIFKYGPIQMGNSTVSMPKEAKVLSVGIQNNEVYVWAMVNFVHGFDRDIKFFAMTTGPVFDFDPEKLRFLGTVTDDEGTVVHVFVEVGH